MKRLYVGLFMFILIINMTACSSNKTEATTVALSTQTSIESSSEVVEDIEEITLAPIHAGTQESPALQKSSFAEEFRSLTYEEAKVIYEAPAEKELLGKDFSGDELLQLIKEYDVDAAPYMNKILYKSQNSDGSWDVYVLYEQYESVVRWYDVDEKSVGWIETWESEMFDEIAEQKGWLIEQPQEEKGVLKTLTAEEIKTIYPDLPWDTDIIRPIKIKLYKDKTERCYAVFVFPKGTGVFTSGFSKVNQQTNAMFGHDDNLLTESRVADYGYIFHDLTDDSVNVVFSDLSYKQDFNNWRVVKFPLTQNRQSLRDHQPSKGVYDKGINGYYDFTD